MSVGNNLYIKDEVNKLLQEARLFASINNPHIIRYNHSWIEVEDYYIETEEQEVKQIDETSEASVDFESPFVEFGGSFQANNSNSGNESRKKTIANLASNKMLKISLYIQMELCKGTLEDYLNKRIIPLTEQDHIKVFKIASQLIEAIFAIHHEHKIIHRDLSLRNIFIGNDEVIKIGDFGLATKCPHLIPVAPSPCCLKPLHESINETPDELYLEAPGKWSPGP